MVKDQAKVQAELMQAYRDVFLFTPQGQIILNDLMKASGLLSMTGLRPDNEVQHLEGSRDMVRRIISIISIDEEKLAQLATGTTPEGEQENG
jgi:hypothetical protein|tara:strand:+ start:7284 stop:7559 length:276 start_codon:yes stop_codon:yes gene_type:complete